MNEEVSVVMVRCFGRLKYKNLGKRNKWNQKKTVDIFDPIYGWITRGLVNRLERCPVCERLMLVQAILGTKYFACCSNECYDKLPADVISRLTHDIWSEDKIIRGYHFEESKEFFGTCKVCNELFLGEGNRCPSCALETRVCNNCGDYFRLDDEKSGVVERFYRKFRYCSNECKLSIQDRIKAIKDKHEISVGGSPIRPETKEEVCREIYMNRNNPNSIMDLIEDWTEVTCERIDVKGDVNDQEY